MLININKNKYIINEKLPDDTNVYSTKIIDELPSDIDEYSYRYVNGEMIRDKLYTDFSKTNNDLETIEEALIEISEMLLNSNSESEE